MNTKLDFLDIAKGIGIILVVVGHFSFFNYNDPILAGIYSFHMPLFFLISGYLINFKKYSNNIFDFLESKFFAIIKPYLLLSIISFLYWGFVNNSFPFKYILGIFYGNGVNGWLDFNLPLWFLPALFFSNIIFFFSQRFLSNELGKFSIAILLSATGCYISKIHILPLSIDVSLIAQIFLYLGQILRNNNKFFNNPALTIIICLPIQFLIAYLNGRVDMNGRLLNNIFLFYAGGCIGSLLILNLSKFLLKFKFINASLSFLGRNSLYIMAYHIFGFSILKMAEINFNKDFVDHLQSVSITSIAYYLIGSIALSLLARSLHERAAKK